MVVAYQIDRKYYVYTLAYPDGKVFYIGKGTGDRINDHERFLNRRAEPNEEKKSIIRAIRAQGKQVLKEKVAEFTNERDAYIYEWALINLVYQGVGLANVNRSGRTHIPEYVKKPEIEPKIDRIEIHPDFVSAQFNGVTYLPEKLVRKRLGISRQALDGYVERGELTKYKRTLARRVFFKESEIERLLEIRPEQETNHRD